MDFLITYAIPNPTATIIPTNARIISKEGNAVPIVSMNTPKPAPADSIVAQIPVSFSGH